MKYLEVGDLLKTRPVEGYWGCAVVLTSRGKTEEFDPMSHIGITTVVFTHDYRLDELDVSRLQILDCDVEIRVGPNKYAHLRRETCIGIYPSKINPNVAIVGRADVSHVYPRALTFKVGDGANGGWPLYGPVSDSLGIEAIREWRLVHDSQRWAREVAAARQSHEEILARLAREDREKRKARKVGA